MNNQLLEPDVRDDHDNVVRKYAGRPATRRGFLITVPHASNAIPDWRTDLSSSLDWRSIAHTHHALDRGAGALAQMLATRLGATVLAGQLSRLFIDLNRPIGDACAITTAVEGRELGFNTHLTIGDLVARRSMHRRYHRRIEASLGNAGLAMPVVLIDLHSFDRYGSLPTARTVDIGICMPSNDSYGLHILAALEALTQPRAPDAIPDPATRRLNVRRDEPYSANHPGAYILRRHGAAAHGAVVLEICDDLLQAQRSLHAIADLLAEGIEMVTLLQV